MADPLQIQLFDAFLGTQEGIHSIILPDLFSSGGSKNLYIDKFGRAKRILGYQKQNATPVTTDTGGSSTLVRALYAYRKTSGGSVTRQLLGIFDDGVNEYELWKSTNDGGTWTFVSDFGAASVGFIPDFGQSGDTLIITNGAVAPKKWDGTSLTTAGQTQSPTITSASSTTGNLTGNYKWKLVSTFASGSRKAGSIASTNLLLQAERGSLTWTADSDVTVQGYELYRTSGTGEVYYFVVAIDGRATAAYTDNTADIAILENRVLEEHGDPPPTAYYAVPHKQRMWYFRTDASPQKGWWSDAGLPESVLDENNIEFSDAETQGDFIVGAKGDYEGKLVVFEERSIWTISGTGQIIGNIADWTRTRTNAKTGSSHHRTVVRIPAGAKYTDQNGAEQVTKISSLAYLTPLPDIRIFDGDNDLIISHPIKTTLSGLNYAQRGKAHATVDDQRGEAIWFYPSGTNGEPDSSIVWNYRWGVWYIREWGFSSSLIMDTSTTSQLFLGGSRSATTGGYVYQLWSGNSFDGVSFRAQWMTKTLYGVNDQSQPSMSNRKRWRWADLLFETEQAVTLTVEWLEGDSLDTAAANGSTNFSPATQTLITANGDTILSSDGDSISVSAASANARIQFKDSTGDYLHHKGIRIRIYDDAQAGSWSLEAMQLAYQILPGLKRTVGA